MEDGNATHHITPMLCIQKEKYLMEVALSTTEWWKYEFAYIKYFDSGGIWLHGGSYSPNRNFHINDKH